MRVLMVGSGVFPVPSPMGGTETHIYWLANSLAEANCQIDLVAHPGAAAFHPDVHIHPIDRESNGKTPKSFARYMLQHIRGGVLAALKARALLKHGARRYDVVHAHGRMAPFLVSKFCSLPLVFTLHDSPPSKYMKRRLPQGLVYPVSYRLFNLGSARQADAVIAVSSDGRDALVGNNVPQERITVIPSGVSTSLFTDGNTHRDQSFLFVGALTQRKGVNYLLHALAQVQPDWGCTIVGDGPERPKLERLAAGLGLAGRVSFAGRQPPDELPPFYAKAGAFVLPSLSEGLPLVLLEAMSASCPPIATRVSGIPSLVAHGRDGLLVAPGSTEELAQAMNRMAASPDLRQGLARAARAKIETAYSWRVVTNRVLAVYEQALAARAA